MTYTFTINAGQTQTATAKNADELVNSLIGQLKNEGDKLAYTSSGTVFNTVTKKTGEYHWNHPGFFFNGATASNDKERSFLNRKFNL